MPDESLTPDELASALLDQEAVVPAHVDPALAARVEEFGAVAAQVGAPVPVDPDRREQAIAAALAEFDAGTRRRGSPPPSPRRRRRSAPDARSRFECSARPRLLWWCSAR